MEHYENLWEAVVTRAVLDLQSESEEIRREAEDWFFIDNEDFEEVCLMIDINPVTLRERIQEGGVQSCRVKN